jgi:predicted Zn-dependent protease
LNPDDDLALVGMAVLAMRQGQDDVAVAQLAHAVKVDPNDVNVLLFAQALRRAGHVAEADSATARVQKISTDLGQAQFDATQFLAFVGLKPL